MDTQRVLFYDLETRPLKAYVWRLGKQVVRPGQLTSDGFKNDIICMAWGWNEGPIRCIDWDFEKQDSRPILEKFIQLRKEADVVIGKNSDRFDNKHINTQVLLHGFDGDPEWTKQTEDLEKQIRKHFALPSYGQDYLAKLMGGDGKIKMEFQDWVDIVERHPERGYKALTKMKRYNKKDVEDLRNLWNACKKHFTLRNPYPQTEGGEMRCRHCGGIDLKRDGSAMTAQGKYAKWYCFPCKTYAGRQLVERCR